MKTKLRTIVFCLAFGLLLTGCAKKDKGKLVRISTSFSLNDAVDGKIENMYYNGTLILEKSNGEELEAVCDTSFINKIRGGQILKVKFDKELNSWKVIGIVDDEK
ncbi:hypothetical protein ACFLSE_00675 [Bacteroidota bacterium]